VRLHRAALPLLLTSFGCAQVASPYLKLLSFHAGQVKTQEAEFPQSIPRFDLPANRLIFDQSDVRLVVAGAFDDGDGVFRIGGLLNPDIQVPEGATITMALVNIGVRGSGARNMTLVVVKNLDGFLNPQPGKWKSNQVLYGKHNLPLLPISLDPGKLNQVVLRLRAVSAGVAFWGPIGWARRGCYGRIIVVP